MTVPGGGCRSLGCHGYLRALLDARILLGTTTCLNRHLPQVHLLAMSLTSNECGQMVAKGDRDPISRTNFNKIHASRFESVIVGETSGKQNFHDQTQIIHESRIPHEINHASHAFRCSRITFLFK